LCTVDAHEFTEPIQMAASVPFSERYLLQSGALRIAAGKNFVLIAIRRAIPHSAFFSKCNNHHSCFASDGVLDPNRSIPARSLELTRQRNPAHAKRAALVNSSGRKRTGITQTGDPWIAAKRSRLVVVPVVTARPWDNQRRNP
jgi:hypothetical protein